MVARDRPSGCRFLFVRRSYYIALGALFLSQVFYVLSHSLVKLGHLWFTLPVLLFARFGVSSAILLPMCVWRPMPKSTQKWLLLQRAFFGFSAMGLYFYALKIGPLGRANLLFSLGVLWGYLFLLLSGQERFYWRSALGIGLALLGLAFLFFGAPDSGTWLSDGAALLGSVFSAGVMVSIKALRNDHSSQTIITWFYGVGALLVLPFLSFDKLVLTWPLAFLVLGVGIFGLLAQWIMTYAYKAVPGSVASSMNLLGMPMMMMVGFLFFSEIFVMTDIVGAASILLGLFVLVVPKS